MCELILNDEKEFGTFQMMGTECTKVRGTKEQSIHREYRRVPYECSIWCIGRSGHMGMAREKLDFVALGFTGSCQGLWILSYKVVYREPMKFVNRRVTRSHLWGCRGVPQNNLVKLAWQGWSHLRDKKLKLSVQSHKVIGGPAGNRTFIFWLGSRVHSITSKLAVVVQNNR